MTIAGWVLWAVVGVFLEGYALGRGGTPLSQAVWDLRFDPVGRFAFLPLWSWLTYRLVLRPRALHEATWRDGLALAIGLAWALAETLRRR